MFQHMMTNKLQIKIDKIPSTHFDNMKLCAFILANFKNESDCMMIEIPLNETSPQITDVLERPKIESSFAPRVTSKIPKRNDFI